MKPVYILDGIHGTDDPVCVDVVGQRKLNENPIDMIGLVQLANRGEQFPGRDIRRKVDLFGVNSEFLTGSGLISHINLRGRILTDEDHSQPGLKSSCGELSNLFAHFLFDFPRDLLPVDETGLNLNWHAWESYQKGVIGSGF